jgi:tape measure domain-containing protein
MATDIAHLIASAEWHGDSAERGLDRLDTKFNKTEKSAQQFGQKITQVGNESNQSTGKIDQAGKAVNSTGDKMERAGKQVGNLSDRLRDSRGKFVSAGQGASEFTGKIKSVDSASESAGSRIGALISKITGFNRASREMGSGGGGTSSFLPGLANISEIIQGIPQIGQLAGALVRPLTGAAEAGVRFNAFMETSKIGFETLLGGSDKALEHLSSLQAFANKTPFQFEDLVGASQRMQAFGFASGDVIPILTAVGDAVSSTGAISKESLDGVLLALGQMKTKGKVSAEEMNQLAERGLPAWELLAKAIGKTVAQTQKLAERGQLNGGAAVSAIAAQMERKYGGQMARVSNTYTGRMSNLEDIRQQAQGKATESLTRDISETIGAALNQGDLAGSLAARINLMIAPVSGLVKTAAVGLLGGGITSGVTEGIAAGKGAVLNAAMDLGLGSIEALATSIGAHSPAVKFIELGEFAGQGFEIGLMNSTRRAFLRFDKLTKEQLENARKIIEVGRGMGAPDKHIRAAISTGIVESKLVNLGDLGKRNDHQSHGVFQQQPFKEWGGSVAATMDVGNAARMFFEHAARMDKGGMSAGDLAARVQRPRKDLRGRYGEALPAADTVISRLIGGGNALPVHIVGGDMGAPTVNDNAYFANKMLTRAPTVNDNAYFANKMLTRAPRPASSGNAATQFFDEQGAGLRLDMIGQVKDASGEILGIWDKLNQTLRDTGQIVIDIEAPFQELKTESHVLGAEFLNLKPLIADIGDGVAKVTDKVSAADQAVGAWADRVIQKSNKTWKEMGDGFQSTFVSALGSTEGGFKGMFGRLGLGFSKMVEQMLLKAGTAKLSKVLFGDTSDDNSAGGLLGKIAGKLSGGKGQKSSQSNESIGAAVNSTVNTIKNAATGNQSKDTTPGAITQAGEAAVGAVKGAGDANTQAIDATGKKTAFSLGGISQNLVQGLAGVANAIAIGNTAGGFWKGLFGAAASGAVSGAIGKIGSGGGSGGASGGGSTGAGDPGGGGTGSAGGFFGGAFAVGGTIKAATGGKLIQVAEGGYDEMVLSTDPKHRERTAALLGSFMQRTGMFPAFAAGGFVSKDSYVPPVVNNYSTSGKSGGAPAVNHHHYNFNIHAQNAQSFYQSERQIQRQLVGAVRGGMGN